MMRRSMARVTVQRLKAVEIYARCMSTTLTETLKNIKKRKMVRMDCSHFAYIFKSTPRSLPLHLDSTLGVLCLQCDVVLMFEEVDRLISDLLSRCDPRVGLLPRARASARSARLELVSRGLVWPLCCAYI